MDNTIIDVNNNICSICLENINHNDMHKTLCKHIFHKECWNKIIIHKINTNDNHVDTIIKVSCPNCRKDYYYRVEHHTRIDNIRNIIQRNYSYHYITEFNVVLIRFLCSLTFIFLCIGLTYMFLYFFGQ